VRTVIGVAKGLDIGTRGQVVAVMVMLQESGIQNYANNGENVNGYDISAEPGTQFWLDTAQTSMELPHDAVGNDADSVGLFQQRASAGWADTPGFTAVEHPKEAIKRLMNPVFAANAFFGAPGGVANQGLLDVPNWENKGLAEAAQAVQGSAYPSAYRKWEDKARNLVSANSDAEEIAPDKSPTDNDNIGVDVGSGGFLSDTFSMPLPEGSFTPTSPFKMRTNPVTGTYELHNGQDLGAPLGTPILAAADGTVVATGPSLRGNNWVVIDHDLNGHVYSTVYSHMFVDDIDVSVGDDVEAGQQVASVGMAGQTTGPHLHFGVWDGGRLSGGSPVDPMSVLDGTYSSPGGMSGGATCGSEDTSGGSGDSGDAGDTVSSIIAVGREQLGVSYSWGGGTLEGPSEGSGSGSGVVGYDCSSLMRYMIYQGTDHEVELPRTSRQQYQETKGHTVATPGDGQDNLREGDLLFYSNGGAGGIYHVAMYIGDGQVIQAPYSGLDVQVADVNLGDNFYAATRVDYSEVSQ